MRPQNAQFKTSSRRLQLLKALNRKRRTFIKGLEIRHNSCWCDCTNGRRLFAGTMTTGVVFGDRIKPTPRERATSAAPSDRKNDAAKCPMRLKGVHGIFTTSGVKNAMTDQVWTNQNLVSLHRNDQRVDWQITNVSKQGWAEASSRDHAGDFIGERGIGQPPQRRRTPIQPSRESTSPSG